jgi:arsenical pump membrane protein
MHIEVLAIFLINIALILFLAIKKPYISIGKMHIETYAVAALFGPILLFLFGLLKSENLISLISGKANPIGILILFLSMVFLSVYLDTVGFMEYCAKLSLKYAGNSGRKLFFILYATVSFLTLFTSNDIIILTLTPFVYYFAKHAKINPKPFLFAEFFAANTWSMMFHISNPTNIFITTAYNIRFFEYVKIMFFPTIAGGLANMLAIYFLFKKDINIEIKVQHIKPEEALKDKTGAVIGVIILSLCTIGLSIAPYFGFAMWKISFISAILLIIILGIRDILTKRKISFIEPLHKMPWSIIPFVLSFFIMVEAMHISGFTKMVAEFINSISSTPVSYVFTYGILSAVASNLLNNIPMSVFFTSIMSGLTGQNLLAAALSSVAGSNLGALFTPLGALAGIMWMSILKNKGIHLSYKEFIFYGCIVGFVSLIATLLVLALFFI